MEVAVSDAPPSAWRPARGGPVSVRIPVDDLSRVGEARRAADMISRGCGLDETTRGRVGIVVTEAATNLARHARDGVILLRDTQSLGVPGLEMMAVDRGPGMQDLSRVFADGFSTGGTPGTGLGAMRRQAQELDVYSVPGQGTIVMARMFVRAPERDDPSDRLLDIGTVCIPLDGETVCGDGWCVVQDAERAAVLLVDGLGHGPNAAEAADVAIATFRAAAGRPPQEIAGVVHEALRATRGAAIAIAEVRRAGVGAASVNFCGVGNTVSALVGPSGSKSLPSMNGTAGLQLRGTKEFSQPWTPGAMLVMHTDGVTTRWRGEAYPGILQHDPAVFAGALHRDHSRGRDDATVLALRLRPESSR
jgi:anti-sigma regulatory factor (Ser/Thr protein kinase)